VPASGVPTRPNLAEVPAAPRTPSPRARKLIFRYTGRQAIFLLVGLIFSVVGIVLSVVFMWGLPSDIAIALAKREVPGQILRAGRTSYTVNGESPTSVCYSYEFGGRRYEASSDILPGSPLDLAAAEPGHGKVTVELAAFHPASARIAGTTNSFFGAFGLLALVFPLVGGLLLAFAIRGNRREIRAFTHGVPVLARVVYIGEDRSTRINQRHPLMISWEFEVGGEVYEGSLSTMRRLEFEELLDAKEVVVLHDPSKPQINTLYVR
jgi:hypothetical protein